MNDVRFIGEVTEPPVLLYCGYCGAGICHGCDYYMHDRLAVCQECVHRYAWTLFIEQARCVCALPENWL